MTRKIDLGTLGGGKPFRADLDIILRSNLLVQANSGGGKSWLLRRMIEKSFSRVPQIVIDPEGEFATLRKRFDVVLVGKGGDTPADVRAAPLLAQRLLELGASAVVDLYEMSKAQRPVWVAAFVQALIDAPKSLWRDLLVYIDEAHEFAPEPGHSASGTQEEKRCRHALIDLAAKGRKRGYGVVAATQRLGKLSKDFAAELKNTLIGQTWIDIDSERAAGSLGISKAGKAAFGTQVKTLEPGSFFALGRALVLEPTLVQVGGVETEHPEAGRRQSSPPPPTAKIKHLLPQLADLPKEAEQKVVTERELRARIAELEKALLEKAAARTAVRTPPQVLPQTLTKTAPVLSENDFRRVEKLTGTLRAAETAFVEKMREVMDGGLERLGKRQRDILTQLEVVSGAAKRALGPQVTNGHGSRNLMAGPPSGARAPLRQPLAAPDGLTKCARALLHVLAVRGTATDSQIAVLSGYSVSSSTFANGMSELRTAGLQQGPPDQRTITDAGRVAAGPVEPLPTGEALLGYWLPRLGKCEAALLTEVYRAGSITREQLSERTGYRLSSSTFANGLSTVRTLELVRGPNGGDLTIADVFRE